jgi:hypothetical protein
VSYAPDGEPFTLAFGCEAESDLIAVGWLDAGFPFQQGEVPSAFIDRLREKCRDDWVNRTRGLHRCTLCPEPPKDVLLPQKTTVWSEGGDFVVGGAEIRIEGPSGTRYASPDMIIHYVEEHGYCPPDDFIQGVTSQRG